MPVPEHLIQRFGGNVPSYIREFYEQREADARQKEEDARAAREAKEREWARVKALRRPPAKVWRIGQTILWSPPETFDQLKPAGYWISEERNGSWTAHGDYVLTDVLESQLYGTGQASVQVYYHDTALGEVYSSPAVPYVEGEHRYLVGAVRHYIQEKTEQGRTDSANRWRRVLAAFGAGYGKWYDLRRGMMDNEVFPLDPPMTATEAQSYADKGWERWIPVAMVLWRLEGGRPAPETKPVVEPEPVQEPVVQPEPTPAVKPEPPSRMDLIVAAVRTFTGRRTRRTNKPYVRDLRKHSGIPDITSAERDEAHRRVTDV